MLFTKRIILSLIAGAYDPLGMIAPLTIKVKIVLQQVVETEATWDMALSNYLMEDAFKPLEMMVRVERIPFPRSFVGANWEDGYEIVGFFDGGDPASAGVVYARTPIVHPHPKMTVDDQIRTHEIRLS